MFAGRVLLLIPHPDDEVVGCAAAIARARAQGAEVHGLYLTTGVPAAGVAWRPDPARTAARVARRRAEALAAARRLGLTPVSFSDRPTRTLRLHMADALAEIRAAVDRLRPGVVWAPAYEGGHQDHDVANALASLVAPAVPVWEYAEYNNAGGRTRSQDFPDARGGGTVLELTEAEQAEKRALLALYASERGNLAHIRSGREAFRPLPAHDYAKPPHEGTLFYARFHWVPFRHPRIDFTRPAEVSRAITGFVGRGG